MIIQASFQVKKGRDRLKNKEKKFFFPNRSYFARARELQKKLKNIIQASFQTNPGWDRLKKRKKKIPLQTVPTRPELENSKKKKKNKNS